MGHVLSFILDQPQRYKRVTFFETDRFKLSSMVYGGENVLVIESKNVEGCRVLLNRTDLIQLHRLGYAIFEAIVLKDVFITPLILKQIDQFGAYLEERCSREKSPPKNIEERKLYIKNMQLDRDDRIVKSAPNLTRQIQLYAVTQLAENWENREAQKSQEVIQQKYIIFIEIFNKNIFYFSHVMLIQTYCHPAAHQNPLSPAYRMIPVQYVTHLISRRIKF